MWKVPNGKSEKHELKHVSRELGTLRIYQKEMIEMQNIIINFFQK